MSIVVEIGTLAFGVVDPAPTSARIAGASAGAGGSDHTAQALVAVAAIVSLVGIVTTIRREEAPDSDDGGPGTTASGRHVLVIRTVVFSLVLAVVASTTIGAPLTVEGATLEGASEVGHVAEETSGVIFTDVLGEAVDAAVPDADGDRLLDSWERTGRAPTGAPLPGADPMRKDLYLQIHYAEGIRPLSDAERADLRRIWAEMPVENPDGSEGITLHVLDGSDRGGRLDHPVAMSDPDMEQIHRYYTPEYLGDARCVYYQTVLGELGDRKLLGRASVPGYSSVVDGRHETRTDDGTSIRTGVLTHELLHNVAGRVDGRVHTERGWLTPSHRNRDTTLSNATARELTENGFAMSDYYEWQVCGIDYRRMVPSS